MLESPLVPTDEEGDAINNSVEPKVKLGVQLTTVFVEDAGTTG